MMQGPIRRILNATMVIRQRGGSQALGREGGFAERDLRRLVERAPDVIIRYGVRPPRFEFVSRAIMRATGHSPEALYANPLSVLAIVHPDDRPMLHELLETGEGGSQLVFRWIRKDRTIAWMEQRSVPVFDHADMLTAVEAIAREIPDPTSGSRSRVRVHGSVRIDLDTHQVFMEGQPIHLTPSEYRILVLLTEQPGRTVSRVAMTKAMWNSPHSGSGRACEVHISKLRAKIEAGGEGPALIETVRGVGYRFIPSG
jgi:PAS domain S-box-containing protein